MNPKVAPAILLILFALAQPVFACPWCRDSPSAAPTVTAEDGDRGGLFFGEKPDPSKVRRYYIAAEPFTWNFLPSGHDPVKTNSIPPVLAAAPQSGKLRYIEYSDETFSTQILPQERLGILGPPLRGVVGESLVVTFLNRTDRPLSMHPHGVKYDKNSEGASYFPERGLGAAVAPNARFTYVWKIDESAGPLPHEPSSKAWLYHSHVHSDEEINAGLIGMIIVTDPKRARQDGTPADIDREMPALFMIFDETPPEVEPLYQVADPLQAQEQVQRFIRETVQAEAMERHTINGLTFGNLRGLNMNEGERVRWYLFGLGSELDIHTAHWHGTRVIQEARRRTDVVELLPGSMTVADSLADNTGAWLFHCHVSDHMMGGMYSTYTIGPKGQFSTRVEEAFLGAAANKPTLRVLSAKTSKHEKGWSLELEASTRVSNLPKFQNSAVEISVGNQSWKRNLDSAGKTESDGLAFHIRPGQAAGKVGSELLMRLKISHAPGLGEHPNQSVPAGPSSPTVWVPLTIKLAGMEFRNDFPVHLPGN